MGGKMGNTMTNALRVSVAACVTVGFTLFAQSGALAAPKDSADVTLKWVFGDIKHPLRGHGKTVTAKPITEENYKQIIDGLKTGLHCNGIRGPIDPEIKDPASYPKVYRAVLDYAGREIERGRARS
jgi:hypothetical protein